MSARRCSLCVILVQKGPFNRAGHANEATLAAVRGWLADFLDL